MKLFDLQLEVEDYFKNYEMSLNPGVDNAVASAALYYFISLMPKHMQLFDEVS